MKEENKRLPSSVSFSFQSVNIPKNMLINITLLAIEKDIFLRNGTIGTSVRDKHWGKPYIFYLFHEKSVLLVK